MKQILFLTSILGILSILPFLCYAQEQDTADRSQLRYNSESLSPMDYITMRDDAAACIIIKDDIRFVPGTNNSRIYVVFQNLCYESHEVMIDIRFFTNQNREIRKFGDTTTLKINGLSQVPFTYDFSEDLHAEESGRDISLIWHLMPNRRTMIQHFYSIENFLNNPVVIQMINLGLPINEGDEPPLIEGSYISQTPIIFRDTYSNNARCGERLSSFIAQFWAQNNESISTNYEQPLIRETGESIVSFISGYSSDFTVYQTSVTESAGCFVQTINIISGMLDSSRNIKNVTWGTAVIQHYSVGDACQAVLPEREIIMIKGNFQRQGTAQPTTEPEEETQEP